jgi:hypothetical protein
MPLNASAARLAQLAGAALFVTFGLCWPIWAAGQARAVCIRGGALPAAMFLASKGCFYAASRFPEVG